jgi:hypothetical protein
MAEEENNVLTKEIESWSKFEYALREEEDSISISSNRNSS